MKITISTKNKKLAENVCSFSISTDSCLHLLNSKCKGCYAAAMENRWPSVKTSWTRNLEATYNKNFVKYMISALKLKYTQGYGVCRVHVGGEFYSDEYIDKWIEIAKGVPLMLFYSYTKNSRALRLKHLDNFVIHNSIAPDGLPNYGDRNRIIKLVNKYGFKLCPSNENKHLCGGACKICLRRGSRPCFIQH